MPYKNGNDWYDTLPAPLREVLEGCIIYDDYYSGILGYALVPSPHEEGHPKHAVLIYSRWKSIHELAEAFEADMRERAKDDIVVNAPEDDPGPITERAFEDADEFFQFNVEGGWLGAKTPLILDDNPFPAEELALDTDDRDGFVGLATRCGDLLYAVYELGKAPGAEITLVHPVDGEIDVSTLELTRIPCDQNA